MRYQAVIFDMDGVLIDSESYYVRRIHEEFSKTYPWVKREDLFPIVGMSGRDDERALMHRLARQPVTGREPDEVDRVVAEVYRRCRLPDYSAVLYPEVRKTLEWLRENGLKTALASSSPMEDIRRMLDQCGLGPLLDFVVSGRDLPVSKPDPAIYLLTLRRLDLAAKDCLVVEDSTYGIRAAAAAGIDVAARLDPRFSFDQSLARYFIRSLAELRPILTGQ